MAASPPSAALEQAFPASSSAWLQPHTLRRTDFGEVGQEVAGESHYADHLLGLAQGLTAEGPVASLHTAQLVRDPKNRYDPNCVEVRIGGGIVGHIPRDQTAPWRAVVGYLADQGVAATCPAAFIGGWDRGRGDRGNIGVTLLAHPAPAEPGCPTLIAGATVAVTGEEHHQDVLAPLVGRRVVAQLAGEDGRITVWIGGQRVGRLTPKMTERYMALISGVYAAGSPVTCWATVDRGKNKREVKLHIRQPCDIDRRIPSGG